MEKIAKQPVAVFKLITEYFYLELYASMHEKSLSVPKCMAKIYCFLTTPAPKHLQNARTESSEDIQGPKQELHNSGAQVLPHEHLG